MTIGRQTSITIVTFASLAAITPHNYAEQQPANSPKGAKPDQFSAVDAAAPGWSELVLHSFAPNPPNGAYPQAGVIFDSVGDLYGTTSSGGTSGTGVIYKLDTAGKYAILYNFKGGADGSSPNGLLRDSAGNLYGTSQYGGDMSACYAARATRRGCGVVFKVNAAGHETVLYTFTGGADGSGPAGVIQDSVGNLYGTTQGGGDYSSPREEVTKTRCLRKHSKRVAFIVYLC